MLHFQEGSFSQKTNHSLVSPKITSTTIGGVTQTSQQNGRSSPIVASASVEQAFNNYKTVDDCSTNVHVTDHGYITLQYALNVII
ncbi:hypothetical protein AHAS_Ahas02G0061700 [Arachis hypogaea]